MGELKVEKLLGNPEKIQYIKQLMTDIEALEKLLENNGFKENTVRIGVEQEFCLVNEDWEPSSKALEILKDLNDERFTSELALYNLEVNLNPLELEGTCFSQLHANLKEVLEKAAVAAENYGSKIMLTGILPTITSQHLKMGYMTPIKRYEVLNDAIKDIRKNDIELHIKGVDELNLKHDSILYEGCNTSFQAHLQIDPADFADTYNWAQAIAGPILSICTNSPLLMGRELWEETRIALFAQSVDTRSSTFVLNEKEARVGFGNDWARGSVADFFKDSVIRFRSLLTTSFESNSLADLESGKAPDLKALKLHNGTVYKWNRLCYGVTYGEPHIRIENRYLPSGPTTEDEIANMMLWVGLMVGRPKSFDQIHTKMDFKDVKGNFFNAARYGMAAQFYWDNTLISSHDLLLDHLLPIAFRGLYSMKIAPADAERYLSVIERRIRTKNGSRWMVEGFRKLKNTYKTPDALKILTATMYDRQDRGYDIDAWQLPRGDEYERPKQRRTVGDIMNTKIITAQESDSAELVLRMMQWKNIHHVPILDDHLDLHGLLTWTDVGHFLEKPEKLEERVASIMEHNLITTTAETLLEEAKTIIESNQINCLPVVEGKKLIGIITSNDL